MTFIVTTNEHWQIFVPKDNLNEMLGFVLIAIPIIFLVLFNVGDCRKTLKRILCGFLQIKSEDTEAEQVCPECNHRRKCLMFSGYCGHCGHDHIEQITANFRCTCIVLTLANLLIFNGFCLLSGSYHFGLFPLTVSRNDSHQARDNASSSL